MQSILRGETDISVSVRKACSPEETAPKRKHVRACAVYTWDHRSGREFWNAVKLLPIQNDEIQLFKALITIHKVLQEGHSSVLKEAQNNVNWIRSLGNGGNGHYNAQGYTRLIDEYVRLLLHKLDFHKSHKDFSGTFEYEEYISLRTTDDPNEGYEAIIDLMNLQDAIDDFQRLVFSSLKGRFGNECKISALIPMVAESYGIYRFITSMLRALHGSNDFDALEPLRSRYFSQHRRLRNFYFDASTLKYLTSLIMVPQLNEEPPNLEVSEGEAPALPKRPLDLNKTGDTSAGNSIAAISAQPTGDWWVQQQQFEDEQRRLQQEQEAEIARQQQLALEQQRQFEIQQQALMAQQQQAQEEFLRQQQAQHSQGQVAELQQQLFNAKNQQDEMQMMLQQYDQRVQALESELAQAQSMAQSQIDARSGQIETLQDQVREWKSKYESLAKLYSQLRQEHLDLLAKYKKAQAKAASASEAIEKRERLERDLKSKNLELADLIRERDRARYELDRLRGQHKDETDRLERDISLLNDKVADSDRNKGANLTSMLDNHSREIKLLEDKLRAKELLLANGGGGDVLQRKDDEIDILKETIVEMENALTELSLNQHGPSSRLDNVIDAVLTSAINQVQDALSAFEELVERGNDNATPAHLLSLLERASDNNSEFTTAFTAFLAEGPAGDVADVIKLAMSLSSTISDVLTNVKGLTSMSNDEELSDRLANPAHEAAIEIIKFYDSLKSESLQDLQTVDEKIDALIDGHVQVQGALNVVIDATEKLMPKTDLAGRGDIGEVVDNEMAKVAAAVEKANAHLTSLLSRPRDPKMSTFDRQINEAILAAAVAVTSAIAALIKAATESQQEIVAKGRGTDSSAAYYKKNHHWTQGLISAARAIAGATNVLIETADGTLSGSSSPEELIVAAKEVASSTAQLVAASRVKADQGSRTQDRLEDASKSVTAATRSLVARVQEILAKRGHAEQENIDYSKLSPHEFRTASMEQQVEVLRLEQQLTNARNRLFAIRRLEYVQQEDE